MRYFKLDKEETQILKDFEAGKYVRVSDFEEQKRVIGEAARITLNKTRNINIRISERDLQKLKARAMREGIPYQTLASSVLRQTANK